MSEFNQTYQILPASVWCTNLGLNLCQSLAWTHPAKEVVCLLPPRDSAGVHLHHTTSSTCSSNGSLWIDVYLGKVGYKDVARIGKVTFSQEWDYDMNINVYKLDHSFYDTVPTSSKRPEAFRCFGDRHLLGHVQPSSGSCAAAGCTHYDFGAGSSACGHRQSPASWHWVFWGARPGRLGGSGHISHWRPWIYEVAARWKERKIKKETYDSHDDLDEWEMAWNRED